MKSEPTLSRSPRCQPIPFPKTRREMEKTCRESVLRSWRVEDKLARLNPDARDLALLSAIAVIAVKALDHLVQQLPDEEEVWGWPILDQEREFVRFSYQQYRPDTTVLDQAFGILRKALAEATADEVAVAAVAALHSTTARERP